MPVRLAIDIGGTFTDFVGLDETTGAVVLEKALTTPRNFADGVTHTIRKSQVDPRAIRQFVHGTTVVINALTERQGAKVALLTTQGFRDVLEIQRANRTDMYNLFYQKPKPFVPRRLRFEVRERLNYAGRGAPALVRRGRVAAAESLPKRKGSKRSPSATSTPTRIPPTSAEPARSSGRSAPRRRSPSPTRSRESGASTNARTRPP